MKAGVTPYSACAPVGIDTTLRERSLRASQKKTGNQMRFGIGQSVRRTEDMRFVTGHGQYADDLRFPDEAVACFVRSPHAHARFGERGRRRDRNSHRESEYY